jgi:hypothetical protein
VKYLFSAVVTFATSLVTLPSAMCQSAVPTDLNRDGKSEFVAVQIESDDRLRFDSFDVVSSSRATLGRIGRRGADIIFGNWTGDAVPEVGVVTDVEKQIRWSILVNGGPEERVFGKAGDTVLTALDLDDSGVADAVVFRRVGKEYQWEVGYDLFSSTSRTESFRFGSTTEEPFGIVRTGRDAIGSVVEKRGRVATIVVREGNGSVQRVPIAPSSISSAPMSLGEDLIVFVATSGRRQLVSYRQLGSRRSLGDFKLSVRGTLIVGDFLPTPGLELAFHQGNQLQVHDRVARRIQVIATTEGIAIDEINVNRVGSGSGSGDFQCGGKTTLGGFGDTFRRSDTRACRAPSARAFGKGGFVPGLSNRTFVASITPCGRGKATLFTPDGEVVVAGAPRGGCPNGRATVDFCAPSGGGAVELARRFGEELILQWETNAGVECFRVFPRYTTRNGRCEPNRAGVNEPGEPPLSRGLCR